MSRIFAKVRYFLQLRPTRWSDFDETLYVDALQWVNYAPKISARGGSELVPNAIDVEIACVMIRQDEVSMTL